jgi:hypothetical protein
MRIVMSHEARQVPAWLIFDVRQSMSTSESSLGPISQAVLTFIQQKRPELIAHTKIQPDSDSGHSILEVRLPAPNARIKYPLYVTTENEELTWGFAGWHGHFVATTEGEIKKVFSQIDAVFQDQVLAVTFERDGKWAGGTLVKVDDDIFTGLFEGFAGSVEVRSWTGARDEDLQTA